MPPTTAWVKPAEAITGLDHLGAHAPCIAIYSQLLPGITNVTDRAVYYSFYPWLLRAIDARWGKDRDPEQFVTWLRRAEVVLTLLATRHEHSTDRAARRHGQGLVGRQKLAPAIANDDVLDLAAFTVREGPQRYFKNPYGGLAQYYLGVLVELGILAGATRTGLKYVREGSAALADAVDDRVDADAFFDVLDNDVLDVADLDQLAGLCPCGIRDHAGEREALLDVLFCRHGGADKAGVQRRASLELILHLAVAMQEDEEGQAFPLDESMFRACTYTGFLPSGKPWHVPTELERTRRAWGTYHRNEILSVAAQGIFWACLLVCDPVDLPENSRVLAAAFVEQVARPALGDAASVRFADAVRAAAAALPAHNRWYTDEHELQLAWAVERGARDPDQGRQDATRAAVDALVALAARLGDAAPYDAVDLPDGYLDDYPINLAAFRRLMDSGAWSDLTLEQVAGWVATNWGIDVHFQVAMRKLRYQGNDTFRIRPMDKGLRLVQAPPPVFTSPRFRQAVQILQDVGALDVDDHGARATALGRALVGAA